MTRKIVVMRDGYGLCKEGWAKLEKDHDVELIHYTGKSVSEFFDLILENEVFALAHTFLGGRDVGPYPEEQIRRLAGGPLKIICHNGAGYDPAPDPHVLKEVGIVLTNTPHAVQEATANTALYLALGALRNFNALATQLRKGEWTKGVPLAHDPVGKTLGIIGMGGIGALARDKMQAAFNLKKVVYYNRNRAPAELERDSQYVDFDTLLETSDIILLSVPLNAQTRHLLDAEALAKCKSGVVIVNTARGAVIDEAALVEALDSGKIASVGLDVFEKEPIVHPGLLKNDNVLLLPHVGTHTIEARAMMEQEVIDNIDSYLRTGTPLSIVPEHKQK